MLAEYTIGRIGLILGILLFIILYSLIIPNLVAKLIITNIDNIFINLSKLLRL